MYSMFVQTQNTPNPNSIKFLPSKKVSNDDPFEIIDKNKSNNELVRNILSINGVTGIFLGSYIKWDVFKQLEIVKNLGFTENSEPIEGTYQKFENLDVYFTVFHDYFKFLKYGFGRTTDHASIEIRYGRISRNEGIDLVKKYEGKIPRKYLKEFLEAADITETEFHEICDKFTNKELFQTDQDGNLLKDKDGNLTLKNEIS